MPRDSKKAPGPRRRRFHVFAADYFGVVVVVVDDPGAVVIDAPLGGVVVVIPFGGVVVVVPSGAVVVVVAPAGEAALSDVVVVLVVLGSVASTFFAQPPRANPAAASRRVVASKVERRLDGVMESLSQSNAAR